MSSPTPAAVVAAFLERCCADLERGELLPLAEYLRIFPGHEAVLTEEYAALVAEDDPEEPAAAAPPFEAGEAWEGRFRLARETRRDGACVLRDADDEALGGRVVVRRLRSDEPGYALARERFRALTTAGARGDAARAAGALLPLAGGDDAGGVWTAAPAAPYAAAPWPSGALAVAEAVRRVEAVAVAVAAAKDAGVLHGGLRPAVLRCAASGAVYVADFGLAPGAGDGRFEPLLTEPAADGARYRSAPRLAGGPASAADDAHALAVLLYEALTGAPPFDAPTDAALARAVAAGRPPALRGRANVSPALESALGRAFGPAAAYPHAAAFLDALRAARAAGPLDRPAGWWGRWFGG